MNTVELLIFSFAIQSFILAVIFLLKKKGRKSSNLIWAIFLMLFAYNIFYNVLYWSGFDPEMQRRLVLVYLIPMSLYGPLFYHYVKGTIGPLKLKWPSLLPHAVPFILVLAFYLRLYLLPLEMRDILIREGSILALVPVNPEYTSRTLSIFMLFYGVLTLFNLKKLTSCEVHLRHWLLSISVCFLLFSASWISYYVLLDLGLLKVEHDYVLTLFMVCFVFLTSFFGHIYPDVFIKGSLKRAIVLRKYKTTGLSNSLSAAYKDKLIILMQDDKMYLDSDLKLNDIAEKLGVSRHHASQIINENFQMGFYDFVNKFRVEEAKRLLSENQENDKVIEIAYKSGFNNKVSFYKAFNKFLGITPTKYLEHNLY